MMIERINGYLGLARRANRLALGETALYQCRMNKAKLLLIASDASDNTRNKAMQVAKTTNVPYRFYLTKTEFGALLGKGSVAILALLDKGISEQVIQQLEDVPYGQ